MTLAVNSKLDYLVWKAGYTSYQELGRKLGVTNATIYSWRAGRTLPRFDKAIELSDLLGVAPKKLLEIMLSNNSIYKKGAKENE